MNKSKELLWIEKLLYVGTRLGTRYREPAVTLTSLFRRLTLEGVML
jgi:hypothetical protein